MLTKVRNLPLALLGFLLFLNHDVYLYEMISNERNLKFATREWNVNALYFKMADYF